MTGCPCHGRYDLAGSPARLAVRPDGLMVCRRCRRMLHPVPYAGWLAEAAAVLVRITKRWRADGAPGDGRDQRAG